MINRVAQQQSGFSPCSQIKMMSLYITALSMPA